MAEHFDDKAAAEGRRREEIAVDIEGSVGGAYKMPDGRSFWIDKAVALEITSRVPKVLNERGVP